MSEFDQQLFGAWRACGLDASPGLDGCLTFCCPQCAVPPSRLDVETGVVLCPVCAWGETGEAWKIAEAAKAKRGAAGAGDDSMPAILAASRFRHENPPPPPVALYSLAGHTIATAENLMVVQAKMKAGKSAAIGAMIAATMEPAGDCLWFASANAEKRAVLHFDTEQSRFDHYQLIARSLRRAGRSLPPPWLYSYHVKGRDIATMRAMVAAALEQASGECGGVHSCIVDGIGDLCADVNDAAESNALVAEMEALAMKFKTLLVCVLHENHNSDSGKTRGHLGSQLARKAETNLRLEKNGEGTTLMYADTSRSVYISKKNAPGFKWDDDAKAHVSVVTTVGAIQAEKAREEMKVLAAECFADVGEAGLGWGQLREKIVGISGIAQATAERAIRKMTESFIITKIGERYFFHQPSTINQPSFNHQIRFNHQPSSAYIGGEGDVMVEAGE